MPKRKVAVKKRNPQDLTLRNLHAVLKKLEMLRKDVGRIKLDIAMTRIDLDLSQSRLARLARRFDGR